MKKKLHLICIISLFFVACKDNVELPTVITSKVQYIEYSEATAGGEIVDAGTSPITSCGVCWSTSPNPTIYGNKTIEPTNSRYFISKLTDLQANTSYYIRAYATSNAGVAYGDELIFTTKAMALALINISSPENITSGYVDRIQAVIEQDGGSEIVECGFVWGGNREPTLSDNSIKTSLQANKFSAKIDKLTPDSTYFLRAYAKNGIGISYSSRYYEIHTLPVASSIEIVAVDTVSFDYAEVKFKAMSSDRANLITNFGIYWSLDEEKIFKENIIELKNNEDREINSLIQLTSLEADTIYYLRPFAKNSYGEIIGNLFELKTLAIKVNEDDEDIDKIEE